ncbi:Uncharacterised protein [uncultured Comamonas sp.]|nr:Uncharacterised protein [uncultured Comamonas sp.]
MPSAGLLCALLLGLAERYLRVRIVFDRHLFAALAAGVLPQPGALDVGLHRLGLRKAAAQPRLLDERINGTLRLARAQVLVVLIQMLVLFCWIVA